MGGAAGGWPTIGDRPRRRAVNGPPTVSVVVPVYGDGADLDRCVGALFGQTYPSVVEVIVVDNGSDPPVSPRWTDLVRVVREDQPGSYAARNCGVASSSGEVVAFTDSDCIADSNWVASAIETITRRGGAAIVTGKVRLLTKGSPSIAEVYESLYAFPQGRYLEEGFGVTANLVVPRQAFEDIGMFDASLRSGGDRDFGARAKAAGWPIVYDERVIVAHPARQSVRAVLAKIRRTAGGAVELDVRAGGRGLAARRTLSLLLPPVRGMTRILRNRQCGGAVPRLAIACLIVLVRLVGAAERARVLAGGTPRR